MSIFNEVKEIIVKNLDVDEGEVKPKTKFSELGLDSLDTVEMIMALEEKFNIQIPDEDAQKTKTVEDVVKAIEERIR